MAVTIVNHEPSLQRIGIRPLDRKGLWFDAATDRPLESSPDGSVRIEVPAGGVRVAELRRDRGRRL